MIQVIIKFHERNPRGGSGSWYTHKKLFDDDAKAEVVEKYISGFKSNTKCGYRSGFNSKIERI